MLRPEQTLNWHPIRDAGRVDNLALRVQDRTRKGIRYLMGCGHQSLPGRTVCERGCLQSPNWTVPVIRHPEWDPYFKRAMRTDRTLAKRLGVA